MPTRKRNSDTSRVLCWVLSLTRRFVAPLWCRVTFQSCNRSAVQANSSWTSCAELSSAVMLCLAKKGGLIVTYLQSAVHGSHAVECHCRLCLSSHLLLFTGLRAPVCGKVLWHQVVLCQLKRRRRTLWLQCWGISLYWVAQNESTH